MPRETIYGTEWPYGPDEPARSIVEVSWTPDMGDVEIATKCVRADDGTDYVPKLEPIEMEHHLETGTGEVIEFGELIEAEGLARSGFYLSLDRRGLNKLIRVLRHARNQAYGADE